MKKILILSYHFEPMNVIASQRTLGYANHFKKFGLEPTILTFQWDKIKDEPKCKSKDIYDRTKYEKLDNYSVIRLPLGTFKRSKILSFIEKSKINKLGILFSWVFGHIDTTAELLDFSLTEKYFLKEHFKTNKYDVVLAVYSPHFHLKSCKLINSKFKIPYVIDFRDLWDNRILHLVRKQNRTEKIKSFFIQFWWKKWSKKALYLSITSEVWAKKLSAVTNIKAFVVSNGFEATKNNTKEIIKSNVFNISSTGTIYPDQNIDIISEGMVKFLNKVEKNTVRINFIGVLKENSDILDKIEKLRALFSEDVLNITKRVSKSDALNYQKTASVLIFPTTPNIPGTLSGKIYEYISSRKPILASPTDIGAVSELINITNSGVCLNDSDEISDFLLLKYNEWKIYGYCTQDSNENEIQQFSRENQTKIQSELINKHICNNAI